MARKRKESQVVESNSVGSLGPKTRSTCSNVQMHEWYVVEPPSTVHERRRYELKYGSL